ncbi:hypothetical protein AUF62_01180 [archaeon 13_1_20CM_52_20]|nr:MAG: hypothetical protein AUF62_01180 [archaeon 13_1_20CM_52_20]
MPSSDVSDTVTVSPGNTVRSGPGDVTVVVVGPHPAGRDILPKRVKEAGLARGRAGKRVNPNIPAVMRRSGRATGLRGRIMADTQNLLWQ